MPIDRAATLRNAEKLLRQGKVDSAIAEYLRIVDEQPRDWNTANILGDLYARTGSASKAVEQFVRIADGLNDDGFHAKAGALYKKILKLEPDHEHALLQSAEIAASQGLVNDARALFAAVEEKRRSRGDSRGAAQARIRLGALDPSDYDARRSAAAARLEIGDAEGAARDLRELGADLTAQNRHPEALEALCEAAQINPGNLEVSVLLAREFLARGRIEEAARYLTVEVAGSDSALLLLVAEIDLRLGRVDQAMPIVERLLAENPAVGEQLVPLACAVAEHSVDGGAALADRAARESIAKDDWQGAAAALQSFAARAANHVPTLQRLVEVCVDGALETSILGAQAQLADAYLAAGMALEARFIAEDLVARDPGQQAHIERLRRALTLLQEPDPDRLIAERLSGQSPFGAESLFEDLTPVEEAPAAAAEMSHAIDIERLLSELEPTPIPATEPTRPESAEVDLTVVLADMKRSPAPAAAPAVEAPAPIVGMDLDEVFEQLRGEAGRRAAVDAAEKDYQRALELQGAGDIDQCIEALQAASKAPKLRFVTASRLGRIYRDRGLMAHAVEWMEQAAQAPAPSPEESHELMFDLAQALEATDEVARALAVCLELQADAGSYRDVDARIDRLAKVQARG